MRVTEVNAISPQYHHAWLTVRAYSDKHNSELLKCEQFAITPEEHIVNLWPAFCVNAQLHYWGQEILVTYSSQTAQGGTFSSSLFVTWPYLSLSSAAFALTFLFTISVQGMPSSARKRSTPWRPSSSSWESAATPLLRNPQVHVPCWEDKIEGRCHSW